MSGLIQLYLSLLRFHVAFFGRLLFSVWDILWQQNISVEYKNNISVPLDGAHRRVEENSTKQLLHVLAIIVNILVFFTDNKNYNLTLFRSCTTLNLLSLPTNEHETEEIKL